MIFIRFKLNFKFHEKIANKSLDILKNISILANKLAHHK